MHLSPLHAFYIAAAFAVAAKTFAWLLQLRTQNAGLVDPIWSFTLAIIALFYGVVGSAPAELRVLMAVMGALWGLRLGVYLWRRNWGQPEDRRYAKFRERWGKNANRNMLPFFQFQNLFTLALSSSAFLTVAYRGDMPPLWACALAVLIWLASVIGEGIADRQMHAFRADPANHGQVCRQGLWRYSRHPNYFFESLHWLAYVPLALGAPWGWASLIAPVLMAWMLTRLSGMPMLEEDLMHRKPGYAEYVRTTSALIPWPPKS